MSVVSHFVFADKPALVGTRPNGEAPKQTAQEKFREAYTEVLKEDQRKEFERTMSEVDRVSATNKTNHLLIALHDIDNGKTSLAWATDRVDKEEVRNRLPNTLSDDKTMAAMRKSLLDRRGKVLKAVTDRATLARVQSVKGRKKVTSVEGLRAEYGALSEAQKEEFEKEMIDATAANPSLLAELISVDGGKKLMKWVIGENDDDEIAAYAVEKKIISVDDGPERLKNLFEQMVDKFSKVLAGVKETDMGGDKLPSFLERYNALSEADQKAFDDKITRIIPNATPNVENPLRTAILNYKDIHGGELGKDIMLEWAKRELSNTKVLAILKEIGSAHNLNVFSDATAAEVQKVRGKLTKRILRFMNDLNGVPRPKRTKTIRPKIYNLKSKVKFVSDIGGPSEQESKTFKAACDAMEMLLQVVVGSEGVTSALKASIKTWATQYLIESGVINHTISTSRAWSPAEKNTMIKFVTTAHKFGWWHAFPTENGLFCMTANEWEPKLEEADGVDDDEEDSD